MKDYTEIINVYMNFFACHLLEYVEDTKTKMYFEDIYSFKKQFNKNVEKCIYELHIPDIDSIKEEDSLVLIDAIIRQLRNKIRFYLKKIDSRESKLIFYVLAAFQAEFHGRINMIIEGGTLNLYGAHPLEKAVLELAMNKKYVYEIREIYACDKYVLEMLLQECLMAQHIKEPPMDTVMSIENFVEIYGIGLTVMALISKRWLIALKVNNNQKMKIENGKVYFQDEYSYGGSEKYMSKFEADMKQYEETYPSYVIQLLDNNFQKMYGFSVMTIKKIAGSMPKLFTNNDLATESNYATIIGEIMLAANCKLEEAERIFAYLLIDDNKEVIKSMESPEKDANRIFEKCILKVGKDRYLYSNVLLGYAYFILLRKLEFNLLEKCAEPNAKIIDKKIKKRFEEETGAYIKQYCSDVLLNVHGLDNGGILSNEVDVIFATKGTLYIVECKDVTFRYTPNGFMADMRKEREFIKKMDLKKESVMDNITYFEEKFDQKIDAVKSYLVYRTANFVTERVKVDKDVTLISFEDFKKVIRQLD